MLDAIRFAVRCMIRRNRTETHVSEYIGKNFGYSKVEYALDYFRATQGEC